MANPALKTKPTLREMQDALASIRTTHTESADSWIEGGGNVTGVLAAAPFEFMYGVETTFTERRAKLAEKRTQRDYDRAKSAGLV